MSHLGSILMAPATDSNFSCWYFLSSFGKGRCAAGVGKLDDDRSH